MDPTTQVRVPTAKPAGDGVSRRTVLKAGLASAAVGLSCNPWARADFTQAGDPSTAFDPERFLVNRISMGFSLPEFLEAKRIGYEAYLERHLDPDSIDDSLIENILAAEFPSLPMGPTELWRTYVYNGTQYVPMLELRNAMLLRGAFSHRQLKERMVEFWTDHFSISHDKSFEMKTVDDREVVRAHALGNFTDMLSASTYSPAMLYYLDNWLNYVGNAQENYARELLELHTLGVSGGYTEADVKEVARVFTGWSIINSQIFYGKFSFHPNYHDFGTKTVLGQTFQGAGEAEGKRVVRILGRHPGTAHFIAFKLCRWLLSHTPPEDVVADVADVYRTTNGDIKAMIRAAFASHHVAAVHPTRNPKIKRPYHYVLSLLRASQATVGRDSDTYRGDYLMYWLYVLGQYPFGRGTPDGYPDKFESWAASLLPRWQFASALFDGDIPYVTVHLDRLESQVGGWQPAQLAAQIDYLFTGGAMSAKDVREVQGFVDNSPTFNEAVIREAMALCGSSPSFQVY